MAPSAEAREQTAGIDLTCPSCGATVHLEHAGEVRKCPSCRQPLTKTVQLGQLLERWYQPRRWRADLVKPSVAYLVERLWTANGQGERLYEGVSPKYANYDHFRYFVTRLMIAGHRRGLGGADLPGRSAGGRSAVRAEDRRFGQVCQRGREAVPRGGLERADRGRAGRAPARRGGRGPISRRQRTRRARRSIR